MKMNTKQLKTAAPENTATNRVTTPLLPVEVPLDLVIAAVRRDSVQSPEQYAKETEIPGGGE